MLGHLIYLKKLKEYLKEVLRHGHHEEEIVKDLVKNGHRIHHVKGTLEKAKKELSKKKPTEEISETATFANLLYAPLAVLFIMFLASIGSKTDLQYVALAFLPVLITLGFIIFLVYEKKRVDKAIWLFPIIISGAYYAIAITSKLYVLETMDHEKLLVFNIIFSMLIFIISISIKDRNKTSNHERIHNKKTSHKNNHHLQHADVPADHAKKYEEPMQSKTSDHLQSSDHVTSEEINKKIRFLNEIIGKVYSPGKGASEKTRTSLKIPELRQGITKKHIKEKMKRLTATEKKAIGDDIYLINAKGRNTDGKEKVIDVLKKNSDVSSEQINNAFEDLQKI